MKNEKNFQRLLKDEEFAEMINVHRGTPANWRAKGVGPPFYDIGSGRSVIRYDMDEVRTWMESKRKKGDLD